MTVLNTELFRDFAFTVNTAVGALDTASAKLPSKQFDEFKDIVQNALFMRSELFRRFTDPRRNIYDECGYPQSDDFAADKYYDLYDRNPIAARVVELMPKECWEVSPSIYESSDPTHVTSFEERLDEVFKSVRPEKSWYSDQMGSSIWEYFYRWDVVSGIGRFGLMLMGFNDGKLLEQPVDGVPRDGMPKDLPPGSVSQTQSLYGQIGTEAEYFHTQLAPFSEATGRKQLDLTFLRVYPEHLVQIVQYEADMRNPRFGWPIMYLVTLNDPRHPHTGVGLPYMTVRVHWSRVLHTGDGLVQSEVFGTPRCRPVLNRLLDLDKLYAGSAEMYWRGAFPGISLETVPSLGGDVKVDRVAIKDMMEQYMNGLQRYLTLMGISAKTLSPTVVDPTGQINTQLQAICIKIGCPQRVFMGSERGEQASTQDDEAWNDRKRHRQHTYNTPRQIVPFVDRLIQVGVLPEPEEYHVEWPDPEALGTLDKVNIANTRTTMMSTYMQSGLRSMMTPMDFFTKVYGMEEEEAEQVLDNANEDAQESPETQPDNWQAGSSGKGGHGESGGGADGEKGAPVAGEADEQFQPGASEGPGR